MTAAAQVDAHVSTALEADGERIGSPMVAALESAWAAIRARHPEVPAVVLLLGAGSIGAPAGSLRLGHFAAMRWHTTSDNDDHATGVTGAGGPGPDAARLPEVFVGGEGLRRGPVDVLGTLLHEAAHALAHVRGIKDTSRQGRWHNARFKALAEELGIEVTKDPRIGWSPTTIPAATRESYASVIAELGAALRLHRTAELGAGGGKTKKPSQPACVCDCGRRIRVAKSVLAAGPIVCGVCGSEFTPDQPDDQGDDGQVDDEQGEERGR